MTTRRTKAQTEETSTEAPKTEVASEDKPTFATEFFKGAGIPYCETCGEQFITTPDNVPICPIKKVGCDRNIKVEE